MTAEVLLTIIFGILTTIIGVITIWQNFQMIKVKVESKFVSGDFCTQI